MEERSHRLKKFPLKIFDLSAAKELAGTAVDTERYFRGFKNVMLILFRSTHKFGQNNCQKAILI